MPWWGWFLAVLAAWFAAACLLALVYHATRVAQYGPREPRRKAR